MISRMSGRSWGFGSGKLARKNAVRSAAKAVLERLEDRRLLSTINWTGLGDGTSWSDSQNWSGGQSPTTSDDVTIYASAQPVRLTTGSYTIHSITANVPFEIAGGSLTLGVGGVSYLTGSLTISGGTLLVGGWASFDAEGATTITGGTISVVGTNATFTAKNAGALSNVSLTADQGATETFAGATTLTAVSMAATNGGQLLFPAATSYTGSKTSDTTIQSSGQGSKIDLAHLLTFAGGGLDISNAPWVVPHSTFLNISSHGEVDLAGSWISNGIGSPYTMSTQATVDATGVFNVAGVSRMASVTLVSSVSLAFGKVTDLTDVSVSADFGATLTFNVATALENANLYATRGGRLLFPAAVSYKGSDQANQTIQANGTDSRIDLSHIQSFAGGGAGVLGGNFTVFTTNIQAQSGGEVDLGGAFTSRAHDQIGDELIGTYVSLDDTSTLGVARITSIDGVSVYTPLPLVFSALTALGLSRITADGVTVALPLISSATKASLQATNGGQMLVPRVTAFYKSSASASGMNSRIDLSHLQQTEDGGFSASGGGEVDVAGSLKSSPDHDPAKHPITCGLNVDAISTLNISGITTMTGTSVYAARPLIFAATPILLDDAITADGVTIQFPIVTSLTAVTLSTNAYAQILLPAATSYSSAGVGTGITATGVGSVIDLSHLQTFAGGWVRLDPLTHLPANGATTIAASAGGRIELAGDFSILVGLGNLMTVDSSSMLGVTKVTRLNGTAVVAAVPLNFAAVTEISGDTVPALGITITANGVVVAFPSVTRILGVSLCASNGGQMLFPLATTYSGYNYFDRAIQADGAGGKIDLSHLTVLTGGGVDPRLVDEKGNPILYSLNISATAGAEVDLAGAFSRFGGNGIIMSSDASGVLGVAGITALDDTALDSGGSLTFASATEVVNSDITAVGVAVLFPAALTVSGTNMAAVNAGQVRFPGPIAYTGSSSEDTTIQVKGVGSEIELAHMKTFAGGGTDPVTPTKHYTTTVKALSGGVVDMAGVIGLSTPTANPNDFEVNGGVLAMNGVTLMDHSTVNITNSTVYLAGTVNLTNCTVNIGDGASLAAADGSSVSGSASTFNATGVGSSLVVRGLLNTTGLALNLPGVGLSIEIGGQVCGTGTINGNLTNAGTVSPGAVATHTTGALTVNGNYTQTADGTLRMDLGGVVPGTTYDRLTVSGVVTLAGSEEVHFLAGYTPAINTVFTTVEAGLTSGTFDGIDGGLALTPSYSATSHSLTVIPMPVDTTPPVVLSWAVAGVPVNAATAIDFTVTYSDNFALRESTIDSNDVTVTGGKTPFSQVAALVKVNKTSDGTPRTATYRISNPAGFNGTYTLVLSAGAVTDIAGNPVAGGTLGQFTTIAGTTTAISLSATTATYGDSVTLTATVTSPYGTPGGTVAFSDGVTQLGTATLNANGVATLTYSGLTAGSHTLLAAYGGTAVYAPSGATPTSLKVQKANATNSLTASNASPMYGQAVTFSMAVSAPGTGMAAPTGTVQFVVDGTNFGSAVALANGKASSNSLGSLTAGSHAVSAVYSGDGNYQSISAAITQTVSQSTTTTSVTSSAQPSVYGQAVKLTATVAPNGGGASPTGTVQFQLDGVDFGSPVVLINGSVTSGPISALSVGSHVIGARYVGDANNIASQGSANQTVTAAATTTGLTVSELNIVYGDQVTFTALVTANAPGTGLPAGQVQFQIDGTDIGSPATLASDGTATYTTSSLLAGSHTIAARYLGATSYGASNTSISPVVNKAVLAVAGITAASKTYDGTVTAMVNTSGVSLTGVLPGDLGKVALVTTGATGIFDARDAGSAIGVTVNGLSLTGSAASNYTTGVVRTSAAIQPRPLTANVSILVRAYDGTTNAIITGRLLVGVVAGDSVTCIGGTAQFTDPHAGTAKLVNVSGLTLSGAMVGDYTLAPTTTTTADILKAKTSIVVSSSKTTAMPGDPLTFAGVVTAAPALTGQGTVQFLLDGVAICDPVALTGVWGTYSTSSVAGGIHALAAVYSGAADYASSTSPPITQYVRSAPTAIALTPSSIVEGQAPGTTVGTLYATDPDPTDVVTFALIAGTGADDNSSFTIVDSKVQCNVTLNYQQKNSYSICVCATDSVGLTFDQVISISVTKANQAPTVSSFSQTVLEGAPAVIDLSNSGVFSDPEESAMAAVKLLSLPAHGTVNLNGVAVSVNQVIPQAQFGLLTYTSAGTYTGPDALNWTGSDGQLFAVTPATISFAVQPVNHAPTDITLSGNSVQEHQSGGTLVGTLSASDPDAGETFTYALVSGAGSTDNASYVINGNQLETAAVFTYETQNTCSVRVAVTDAGGLSYEKVLTINVTQAPDSLVLSGTSVVEYRPAGTSVGVFSHTEPDGRTFVYKLIPGFGDNSQFTIDGDTLKTANRFVYAARSSYTIKIKSVASNGVVMRSAFAVNVEQDQAPTDLILSNSTVGQRLPVGTRIGVLSAVDPDPGEGFTYTLLSVRDYQYFKVANGKLKTRAAFDVAERSSYVIKIRATDLAGNSLTRRFRITVTA